MVPRIVKTLLKRKNKVGESLYLILILLYVYNNKNWMLLIEGYIETDIRKETN